MWLAAWSQVQRPVQILHTKAASYASKGYKTISAANLVLLRCNILDCVHQRRIQTTLPCRPISLVATRQFFRGLRCSVHRGDRAQKMTQVICLQRVAIVDHVAHVTDDDLMAIVGDEEQHGSRRIDAAAAQRMLQQISALLQ